MDCRVGQIACRRLASPLPNGQTGGMKRPALFDDLDISPPAWRRFRQLMMVMGGATALAVVLLVVMLHREMGAVSIHLYIAAGLGVTFAMLLMAVLMGLVFLSSNSGHDEAAIDPEAGGRAEGDQSDG